MSREWLFIEANDVLMFRDSRPFAAGQNFKARSLFPPTPRTMQGVIRTHYLEVHGMDWSAFARRDVAPDVLKAIGGPDDLGELRLEGPFIAQAANGKLTRLVQAPLDLLQPKGDKGTQQPILLAPEREPSFKANAPFEGWRALRPAGKANLLDYETATGWLDDEGLAAYLQGMSPAQIIGHEAVFEREDRVGIGLSEHRTAQRSLFYEAQFIRPKPNVGLLVGVNAGLFPDGQGMIAIGGEGRSGWYRKVPYSPALPQATEGRVKVVLLTPAYFSGGWQPANGDWSPWLGAAARLVSLAIGKPLLISGWDLARKRPRPLHHYLPAGSVFFFEDARVPDRPFTETPPDSPDAGAMGFGSFVAGNWDYA
jgi:CRISPR-associated protein Cmr3